MITLHHLNQSRSMRILWLLEEIKQPYTLKRYFRDAKTRMAPAELKQIHPLGKSPVIELDGKVIAESGAIVELLIQQFAPHLAPEINDPDFAEHLADYLQWIHFSESSAMLPYLLNMFNGIELKQGTKLVFLEHYAQAEFDKVFGYVNDYLADKDFLVANRLTGADFMMGFVLHGLVYNLHLGDKYPNFQRYVDGLTQLESWQKAADIEQQPV